MGFNLDLKSEAPSYYYRICWSLWILSGEIGISWIRDNLNRIKGSYRTVQSEDSSVGRRSPDQSKAVKKCNRWRDLCSWFSPSVLFQSIRPSQWDFFFDNFSISVTHWFIIHRIYIILYNLYITLHMVMI